MTYDNLDMIISLGYRVRSKVATHFRKWATERLKEYIIKGFTMDDERLKQLGGGNYWKELLDRIRDIRSSEKVMYRQVRFMNLIMHYQKRQSLLPNRFHLPPFREAHRSKIYFGEVNEEPTEFCEHIVVR